MRCIICNNQQVANSSFCPQCKAMSDRVDYLLENCPDRLFNYIEAISLLTQARQELNAERSKDSKRCGTAKVSK